jgi:hypothetical protein
MEISILRDRIGFYRNIYRASRLSGCRLLRESNLVYCGAVMAARGHREFWTPLLIRRDFSGLTLTPGKP